MKMMAIRKVERLERASTLASGPFCLARACETTVSRQGIGRTGRSADRFNISMGMDGTEVGTPSRPVVCCFRRLPKWQVAGEVPSAATPDNELQAL